MGKIPVVTLANKSSKYVLDREDTQTQLENLNFNKLANVVESLATFVVNFNLDTYSKILKDGINSNIANTTKMTSFKDFALTDIKEIFLENGLDIELSYTYSNSNNEKFTLTEKNIKFIPEASYTDFTFSLTEPDWGYRITSNELYFKTPKYYGTIKGDVLQRELLSILEEYYIKEYEVLFKELPRNKPFAF